MVVRSGKDVLLALLLLEGETGREGEEVVGLTRMQKLVFLLGKETSISERMRGLYDFKPCFYGPFDEKVQDDLEALKDFGLVKMSEKPSKREWDEVADEYVDGGLDEKTVLIYSLTDAGMEITKRLIEDEDPDAVNEIARIKRTFNKRPVQKILKYVYSRYEDMAAKSLVRKDILQRSA